jgi:hypothetical protein
MNPIGITPPRKPSVTPLLWAKPYAVLSGIRVLHSSTIADSKRTALRRYCIRDVCDRSTHVALFQEVVMHTQQKQRFIKGDEPVAMAELRERRAARTPQRKALDWLARYWMRANGS